MYGLKIVGGKIISEKLIRFLKIFTSKSIKLNLLKICISLGNQQKEEKTETIGTIIVAIKAPIVLKL